MMNKRRSFLKLIAIFLIVLFTAISCKKTETLTVQVEKFPVDFLKGCQDLGCAKLEIFIPKALENTKIANNINQKVDETVSDLLNLKDTDSTTTISQVAWAFNKEYQHMKKQFPDETSLYEATVDGTVSYQDPQLISLVFKSYIFTGGAHGNSTTSFANFDKKSGKFLKNKMLFKDLTKFKTVVEVKFREHFNIPTGTSINSTGFLFENDIFKLPTTVGFSKYGVVFHYNQYEAASYANGPLEFTMSYQKLRPFLKYPFNGK